MNETLDISTISVSNNDPLRLDLSVPGEQQFYLRASTSQERQQWLVALGSAKACVDITKKTGEPGRIITLSCWRVLR